MTGEDLSEKLTQFIHGCIDSVEQLRVLLLLHAHPERDWTAAEITSELRSVESSITKRLADLYARKVLAPSPTAGKHRYLPFSPEVSRIIHDLAEQNLLRPYRVIDAIYSRPTQSIQDLADAFKLRGDKS